MILASASPRRIELVKRLGLDVRVVSPAVEELISGEAVEVAVGNARAKACSVAPDGDVVLGADTVVCLDGALLGKPGDDLEAGRMLRLLSGRTHTVVTGVCLTDGSKTVDAHQITRVTFMPLEEETIERYVAAGLSRGKAGAYGIQDTLLNGKITAEGDTDNVMGLPVALVAALMKEHFHDHGNCR